MSNEVFLEQYLSSDDKLNYHVLLPHEKTAVDLAVARQRNAYDEVIEQKIQVSGGDDWHDGAFVATDNQAKVIGTRMSAIAPYLGATIVDYPLPSESRVTLGSRVLVNQRGYSFPLDIVGFREGHPEDLLMDNCEEDVLPVSPSSPIASAIIGLAVGDSATYEGGAGKLEVIVAKIDQLVIKNTFVDKYLQR